MTEEELHELEKWAELPYSLEDLAIIARVDVAALRVALDDPDSPIGNAIKRGRLIGQGHLYKKLSTLSNQGSGPAQALLRTLFERNPL